MYILNSFLRYFSLFSFKHGRVVFDGGGVEADVKVKLPKPSALEIALQVSMPTVAVTKAGSR